MRPQISAAVRSKFFHSILLTAAIFVSTVSLFAKSVADYQKSVRTARDSVDELSLYFAGDKTETNETDAEYERELIVLIRENLPAEEKIEWHGAIIETNNQWVTDKIDAFVREKDQAKRAEILNAVGERLDALHEKLVELENPSLSDRTKDENKRKLAEILRREDYQKPEQKQESLLEQWWREFTEWLESVFPRPNLPEGETGGFRSFYYVLQIAVYAIIALVIGFLLYKFAPLFTGKYAAKEKRAEKERMILGERIAANDSAQKLFDEAEKLAREGNLRAAIRKGYIAVLCDLNDKKIISTAQHKTNRDYLRDVRRRRELYENMSDLTNSYERHWYGFQTTNEADWNEFRREYQKVTTSSP